MKFFISARKRIDQRGYEIFPFCHGAGQSSDSGLTNVFLGHAYLFFRETARLGGILINAEKHNIKRRLHNQKSPFYQTMQIFHGFIAFMGSVFIGIRLKPLVAGGKHFIIAVAPHNLPYGFKRHQAFVVIA